MATTWSEQAISDLRGLVGDIDNTKLMAILALDPTPQEIEEAVAWIDEGADLRPNSEWPIKGKVADIYDILIADIEEDQVQ